MVAPLLMAAAESTHASGGGAVALLVVLAVAGIVSLCMSMLKLPVMPGYLVAGVMVGPGAAALIKSSGEVETISHLAMILLMFGIGLHLDIGHLKGSLARMLAGAAASIALAIAVLWAPALALTPGWAGALVIAMALSLSSTAVVLRLLVETRRLAQEPGRFALAILVAQDLSVIGMLVAVPILAHFGGTAPDPLAADLPSASKVLSKMFYAVLAVAGVALFGRVLLPILLGAAARRKAHEVLMIVALAFALGSAIVTAGVGLSAELGAFLAGLLLASTPFRHQLSGQIGPMRDLFIAVFFTTLGTRLDLEVVREAWPLILGGTLVLLVAKSACIAASCWIVGTSPALAVTVGLWLAQGGEFGFVIVSLASTAHGPLAPLIDDRAASIVNGMIILSLIVTPAMFTLAPRAAAIAGPSRMAPWHRRPSESPDDHPHAPAEAAAPRRVIVAGMGVVGRAVVERLKRSSVGITVIEMNPQTVRTQALLGLTTVYGDAAGVEVLEQAGIEHAHALVLTIPDEQAVLRAVETARQLNPDIIIIARTNFLSRGMMARALGANHYIVEEIVAAEAMERLVEKALGGAPASNRPSL